MTPEPPPLFSVGQLVKSTMAIHNPERGSVILPGWIGEIVELEEDGIGILWVEIELNEDNERVMIPRGYSTHLYSGQTIRVIKPK